MRPDPEVVDAINDGRVTTKNRIEFYEADGETRWLPNGDGEDTSRLEKGGSVSVSYGDNERRVLDVTLDNRDNALRPDPNGGVWYDKIVKAYRGVRYTPRPSAPPVVIIEEWNTGDALAVAQLLSEVGFTNITIKLDADTADELYDYSIIVSACPGGKIAKTDILLKLAAVGRSILTFGGLNTATELPTLIATSSASGAVHYGITPPPYDTPVAGGWGTEDEQSDSTSRAVLTVTAGTIPVALWTDGVPIITAMTRTDPNGSRWFHYHPTARGTQAKNLIKNGIMYLWNYAPFREWEMQVGEFVVDGLSSDHFPHKLKMTGRDYVKKISNSKVTTPISFDAGTSIDALIVAVAANAGITKFNVPTTGETLGSSLGFDKGTDRWKIVSDAAASINLEIFFDQKGFLTTRDFLDPSVSPVSQTFLTGPGGNLAGWSRSVNDSRLYNHVIVTGTPSSSETLPFHGEALNTEPTSPTRIERIGDRSYFYDSSFFTSDDQCLAYAQTLLKTVALESYEMSWNSITYPWLEVGEIADVLDPARLESEPTRFLMDTLTIPLDLGSMSSTGKRVTIVGG